MSEAMAALRADVNFKSLLAVVIEETKEGMERPALSHHMASSCYADGAPMICLKAAGYEIPFVAHPVE